MNMPVFLVINATINPAEETALNRYFKNSKPLTQKYGAVPVASYSLTEALDEKQHPEVCAIMSFPSKETIYQLFNDPDYLAIVKDRDLGFSAIRYYVGHEQVA